MGKFLVDLTLEFVPGMRYCMWICNEFVIVFQSDCVAILEHGVKSGIDYRVPRTAFW